MPDYLDKPPKTIHFSVSQADAGAMTQITRENALAWEAIPIKYRKVVGDTIEEMTAPEKAAADAAIADAEQEAAKDVAETMIDGNQGYDFRAIAKVLVDEINSLRQRDRDRSADVAAATNLADLKTRWAARSALADRTLAQAKNAYKSHLSNGTLDE